MKIKKTFNISQFIQRNSILNVRIALLELNAWKDYWQLLRTKSFVAYNVGIFNKNVRLSQFNYLQFKLQSLMCAKMDHSTKKTISSDAMVTEHSKLKYLNADDDRYLLRGVLLLTDYMHNNIQSTLNNYTRNVLTPFN